MARPSEEEINYLLEKLADNDFRRELRSAPIEALRNIGWSDDILKEMKNEISKIEVNVSKASAATAVGTNCNWY